jgi:hypothetical protein
MGDYGRGGGLRWSRWEGCEARDDYEACEPRGGG